MLRIYDYIKLKESFFTFNYNILGLKKVKTFESGELKTVLYNDDNGNTVVREDIVYVRDDNDYVTERVKTITWIRTDGTDHNVTKETHKDYSSWEASKEGEIKRSNQITDLKITTVGLIAQTDEITQAEAEVKGIDMLLELDSEIVKYKLGAKQPLIDAINADTTNDWLDNDIGDGATIRQYLTTELAK